MSARFDFAKFMERVEWLREYQGKSMRDVAKETGVAVSTYSRAVAGTGKVDIDNLASIARWARLKLDDFVVGDPS